MNQKKALTAIKTTPRRSSPFMIECTCIMLLVLIFTGYVSQVRAGLVSSSRLEKCTQNGIDPIECNTKLVVALSVEADLKPGAEEIHFIDSAELDESGETVTFEPITMTLGRTLVYYRYPIFYTADYNADPYELTIKGSLTNQCVDSLTIKATCGLQYASNGQVIPYSQGFCCSCGMCSAVKLCSADARAAQACNIVGAYTSAACLRFGETWYSGYSVGNAMTWFEIEVHLSRKGKDGTVEESTLVIGPDKLEAKDAIFGAHAQLIGTFNPPVEPHYFGDKTLFIPSRPYNGPLVAGGAKEYMILPNTMVTPDGTECNKVGVSYYGFNAQGNRCHMEPGSCLQNQLDALRDLDRKREAAGLQPIYLSAAYGEMAVMGFQENENSPVAPHLTYVSPAPPNTLITVTLQADSLSYVVSVSTGEIVYASLNMEEVTALTKDALMLVQIQNTGKILAKYSLSVSECTGGVMPIPGRYVTLGPNEIESLTFNVYMQENQTQEAGCDVALFDAVADELDRVTVTWTVKAIDNNNGTQSGGGSGNTESTKSPGGCERCSVFNVFCSVRHFCIGRLGGFLALVGGIGLMLFLMYFFRSSIFGMMKCCCGCCCASGDKKKKKKKKKSKPEKETDTDSERSLRYTVSEPVECRYYYENGPSTVRYYAHEDVPDAVGSSMRQIERAPDYESVSNSLHEPCGSSIRSLRNPRMG